MDNRKSSTERSRKIALGVLVGTIVVVAVIGLTASGVGPVDSGMPTASAGASVGVEVALPIGRFLPQSLPATASAVDVPILMYHYVDEEPPDAGPYSAGLTVKTEDFAAQMEYMRENGYHTVDLGEIFLAMAGERELPPRAVALTFDDGGVDNYTRAFPILKQHGFKATFFVITESVGRLGQMDWSMLREMALAGMAIGSHTVSHPDLTDLEPTDLMAELVDSRGAIGKEIGVVPYALSYPAGAYDAAVIEAARAAGYRVAVTTNKGEEGNPTGVFEMKRRRVHPTTSLEAFARLLR